MSARFSSAIRAENERGYVTVIPDIKCISPKEGDMLKGRSPIETAKQLVCFGAPVLSVVTERERFGGSPDLLQAIAKVADVPILRKDFIKTKDMLKETADIGAAAVLLICAIMNEKILGELIEESLKLGLEPFVEVCTAREMKWANRHHAQLVGINNRDIVTLELDDGNVLRTATLAIGVPEGALLVSESGILSPKDAEMAVASGADAVLVGTVLWPADDMEAMYQSLRVKRREPYCARP
jgi:indole-3-glycerol phosphate synthase